MRRVLLAATALALVSTTPAAGQSDDPAQLARATADQVVHVDERASGRVSAEEAGELRLRIAKRDIGRIKILVVPPEAAERNGGLISLGNTVARLLDLRGALVVVAGDEVRVATSYDSGPAVTAVQEAMAGPYKKRIAGDLEKAVDNLARVDPGPEAETPAGDDLGANDFLDGIGDTVRVVAYSIAGVIAFMLLVPLAVWGVRSYRRRRAGAEDLEADRDAAREELIKVGDMLRELDLDAEMPGADPAGKEALGNAIDLYDRAGRELTKANN